MDINELQRNIERLNVRSLATSAIAANTDKAANRLREQLYRGFDAENKRLRRYQSAIYAQFKADKNPIPGPFNPDLYLTGAFHRSIRASATAEGVTFDATDTKAADLVEKYSDSILDISDQTGSTFAEDIRSDFEKQLANITGCDVV